MRNVNFDEFREILLANIGAPGFDSVPSDAFILVLKCGADVLLVQNSDGAQTPRVTGKSFAGLHHVQSLHAFKKGKSYYLAVLGVKGDTTGSEVPVPMLIGGRCSKGQVPVTAYVAIALRPKESTGTEPKIVTLTVIEANEDRAEHSRVFAYGKSSRKMLATQMTLLLSLLNMACRPEKLLNAAGMSDEMSDFEIEPASDRPQTNEDNPDDFGEGI